MKPTTKTMSRRAFVGVSAAALASLALGGCAQTPVEEPTPAPEPEPEPQTPANDVAPETTTEPTLAPAQGAAVIAVFSRTGNTLALAEAIQTRTNFDLVRIEPAAPFPDDYDEMLTVGQRERDEDARPALADSVSSLADYDTVYLGFPVWWGHIPQIIRTLADRGDLAGKTIAPFCTSGSSSISTSVADLRELCPDATVLEGLTVTESGLSTRDTRAEEWLASLGL
ncbi:MULTISPECIES: flavodoxin [Gordonibacter]|uniref:Flavodoxin n=1 Tax=Gordonibacter faecis TaxID=3047475 RepID=A0ABT7DSM2_9ACTN|nr:MULTISPECIES: flavodoxin [unclassified Gordonibacter]MDJ1651170.1 flavodoxin [Gordonibacter sp. KGMB12511]HIW77364.1 NAD(P)H-dependent oxidoreductase [Candidatus Gordonibacter avicola]